MGNPEHITHAVFTNITDVDTPEHFEESLNMMFDSFMNSEAADTARLRLEVYGHYLNLKKFLKGIKMIE